MNNARLFEKTEKELISMFADEEVNYWATKWGVTRENVKSAVKLSGSNSVSRVYTYLLNANKIRLV